MRDSHKVLLLSLLGILSQATSILLGVVLVRYYDPTDYGTFRQAFFVVETVAYVATLAFPASLLYFLPGLDRSSQKGVVIQTQVWLILLAAIGSLILRIFSGRIAEAFANPDLAQILVLFSLYPILNAAIQHIAPMYMGLNRYKASSAVQALVALAKFVVIALAAWLGADIFLLMNIVMVYMAVQWVTILGLSWHEFRGLAATFSREVVVSQLKYTVPLGLSGVVWFLGKEVDKYCVAAFVPPAMYAVYAVGALEIPLFREITTAISVVLVPRIAESVREGRDDLARLWREVTRKSALVFIPSFAVLMLMAEPLITVLYTDEYTAAVPVFRAYLGLILLRVFNPGMILLGIGKTQVMLWNSLAFVFVNTALNIVSLVVLDMGIVGPALATVVAFIGMNVIGTVVGLRSLRLRLADIVPGRALVGLSLISGLAYVAGMVVSQGFDVALLRGAVAGTTFTVVFGVMAYRLGLYTQDDLNLIVGRFRRQG